MLLKISILVENTALAPGLIGEYGLAVLVEIDDKRILFDTGSNGALLHNSVALGVNLNDLDGIILSHGHFDHTGGLLPILAVQPAQTIYAHSKLFAQRSFPLGNGAYKEIGCAFKLEDLAKNGPQLIFVDQFTEIWPQVYLSGEIPRLTDYEDVGGRFEVEACGQRFEDKLEDDIALIIRHPDGLVIVSGCAHSGLINIIEYAIQQTGESRILAFIGGTHLITASPSRLDKTIAALKSYSIEKIIVSHCTGFYAAAQLYNELGNKVIKGDAGMSFTL